MDKLQEVADRLALRDLVQQAFGSLPWRSDDDTFRAQEAVLLRPSEWDDVSLQKPGN